MAWLFQDLYGIVMKDRLILHDFATLCGQDPVRATLLYLPYVLYVSQDTFVGQNVVRAILGTNVPPISRAIAWAIAYHDVRRNMYAKLLWPIAHSPMG